MSINYTSNKNYFAVFLGNTGNTVSFPIKFSAYLAGYGDQLDSKTFAEIELHDGAFLIQ